METAKEQELAVAMECSAVTRWVLEVPVVLKEEVRPVPGRGQRQDLPVEEAGQDLLLKPVGQR